MIAQVATPTIRVPDSLTELDQWIVWRHEQRDGGKPTKVPYQINGSHASSTDTKTWCSWDEALKAWQQDPRRWSGIGFVFSPGDAFFGIDLDQCLDAAGKLKPWAQAIMERFFDSYAEISPSGRGIKIWGKGGLPGGGAAFPLGDGRVEIYDQARYFTVTGNHWAGQMLNVEEHQTALDWLLALSPHGQKKVPFTLDEGKIPKGSQHDTLVSLAGTMRARGCEYPEIEAALLEINRSRLEEPAPEENIKRIAGSVCRYAPGRVYTGPEPAGKSAASVARYEPAAGVAPEIEAPEFSEDSLAARFTQRHADDLRYVAAWGRWLQWDSTRWVQDDTLHVFDRAREICRAASAECATKPTVAARVASAATVAAIERLVRADRRHAAVVDQWDSDAWLLNTPDGIVDLRTGDIEVHRRDAYCTKMTAASPGGACPLWNTFLDRVTDGDRELQTFLRRMMGYCLTADTREHALFFLYGTGANGKSVFLSTVAGILNAYSKSAAIETFIASPSEHHPTDLAGLQGARLVTATETEDGRRWAESKIKALTGGDRIAARFMRQDFFEFTPVFKLVIAGNHKPGLRSVDEAIRRRLHLVPFVVTIPPAERDLSLSHKLRAEWGGILGWALGGCLEWQARGLTPPASVRDATEAYMAAEDGLAQWLDARCVQVPNAVGTAARLFADWKTWAESAGEYVGSQKRFSQTLEERGFKRTRVSGVGRGFQGIGLRAPDSGGGS
jgi:putative DNA primase/helicase